VNDRNHNADKPILETLERIAAALERLAPPAVGVAELGLAEAYLWRSDLKRLEPVARVNRVDLSLLKGIDQARDLLLDNTERFARGLPANNALLWGARGMGKSSLVKAVHAEINRRLAGDQAHRDPPGGY
jgi:predicted AAA+ superfamily ATPase